MRVQLVMIEVQEEKTFKIWMRLYQRFCFLYRIIPNSILKFDPNEHSRKKVSDDLF